MTRQLVQAYLQNAYLQSFSLVIFRLLEIVDLTGHTASLLNFIDIGFYNKISGTAACTLQRRVEGVYETMLGVQ